jgi:hypothetical protein
MKRPALFVLAAALLAGHETPLVRSDVATPSQGTADDVFEAAFRGQIEDLLDSEARARGLVLCLAVDPGGAPQSVSREFLRRFRTERSVRRGAECEARSTGAITLAPRGPAIIVTAGPIEWVAADEAWVTVSRFPNREAARRWQYRVVRETAGWVCLGPIIKQAPA